jgi:hypothetical protein
MCLSERIAAPTSLFSSDATFSPDSHCCFSVSTDTHLEDKSIGLKNFTYCRFTEVKCGNKMVILPGIRIFGDPDH